MFQLTKVRTANGIKLSQKLWDFLTLNVGKRFDTRWQDKQIDEWAGVFDVFLMDHDFLHVCDVFDYYVAEWKKKRGYVYLTPDAFVGDYVLLEQRMEWNNRPIPEADLKAILRPLAVERWECEWDYLVTAVSKSVYAIRSFLKVLTAVAIPADVKKRIRGIFGNVTEYVIRHFLNWRRHQIEAVWVATISYEFLLKETRKCLTRLGYPACQKYKSIMLLESGIKEVCNVHNGNRPR